MQIGLDFELERIRLILINDMDYKDYYSIVGVEKTATQDEIKKSYRKKAGIHHPDKNPGDKKAEQNFKDLQEAYEVLKDPEKRKLYDQVGSDWKHYQNRGAQSSYGGAGQHSGSGQYSDFFESFFGGMGGFSGFSDDGRGAGFGGGFQQRAQAQPLEAELEVTLDDIYQGLEKKVMIQGNPIKVKLPKGIEDGKKLKLKGKAPNGADLYLVIKTKLNTNMERNGADLVQTVLVSVWDALLGTSLNIKTLKGELNVKIPELSKPDSSLRLKGYGLPHFHHENKLGDLYIKVRYALPEVLSDMQKMLIKELKN